VKPKAFPKKHYPLPEPAKIEQGEPANAGNFRNTIEYGIGKMHVGRSAEDVENEIRMRFARFQRRNPKIEIVPGTLEKLIEFGRYVHQCNFLMYAYVMGGR
jgi:hypothetical protein